MTEARCAPTLGLLSDEGAAVSYTMSAARLVAALRRITEHRTLIDSETAALEYFAGLARRCAASNRFFDSAGQIGSPPDAADRLPARLFAAALSSPQGTPTLEQFDRFARDMRAAASNESVEAATVLLPTAHAILNAAERPATTSTTCGGPVAPRASGRIDM